MSQRTDIGRFLVLLARAVQTFGLYRSDHRMSREALREAYHQIHQLLSRVPECVIGLIGEEIVFEKKPFRDVGPQIRELTRRAQDKGIKKISFSQGLTEEELAHLIELLASRERKSEDFEFLKKRLIDVGVTHIRLGHIGKEEERLLSESTDPRQFVRGTLNRGLEILERESERLKSQGTVDGEAIRFLASALVNCLLVNRELLLLLTFLKLRGEKAYRHNLIVCVFTLLQAELLGLCPQYAMEIATAALLHNIGTLAGPPEDADWVGAKLLIESEGVSPLAALVAIQTCHPGGDPRLFHDRSGRKPNLISLLISIAKEYDTLRHDPQFARDGGIERIYEVMRSPARRPFSSELVSNFFHAIGVYPPGTLVRLDTGEVALVLRPSLLDLYRPRVEILYDPEGQRYPDPFTVSLLEKDEKGRFRRSIAQSIVPTLQYRIPVEWVA